MNIKSLVKAVIINGLFLGTAYYIHQNAVPGEISWTIAGAIVTVLWITRIVVRTSRKYKEIKNKAGGTISVKNIDQVGAATLPNWMLGYYATEKQIYRHAWRALTFASVRSQKGFHSHVPAGKGVKALVWTLIMGGLGAWGTKATLDWLGTGATGIISAVVTGGLALYAIAWILGDWRAAKDSEHRVGDDMLHLQLGVRSAVDVPFSVISRCTEVSDGRAVAVSADGGAPLNMSAAGPANVLVELTSKQVLPVVRFGYPVPANTSVIALRLVNPRAFVDMVAKKMEAGAAEPAAKLSA